MTAEFRAPTLDDLPALAAFFGELRERYGAHVPTEGKLRAYNPRNRNYAAHVLEIMSLLGPEAEPTLAPARADVLQGVH